MRKSYINRSLEKIGESYKLPESLLKKIRT